MGALHAPAPDKSISTPPGAADARFTLDASVQKTIERELRQGLFELESERILDINLNGEVWTKTGAMVAYTGQVKFFREKLLERGLGDLLKSAVGEEGVRLAKATGNGSEFCADTGKKITILQLQNEAVFVNGNDLLALEPTLQYDVQMTMEIATIAAGGLFNIRIEGTRLIAVTSHYDPLTLLVPSDTPATTDPNATVMWSGGLTPKFKTDMHLKTFIGRGSGESVQMAFQGDRFVVVQPYEEVLLQSTSN